MKERIGITFEVFETSKVLFEHVPGKTFGVGETPKVCHLKQIQHIHLQKFLPMNPCLPDEE